MNLYNKLNIHFNRSGGFKLGSLSKKTRYDKIRNYPENTDVVVNYYYENKNPTNRGSEACYRS